MGRWMRWIMLIVGLWLIVIASVVTAARQDTPQSAWIAFVSNRANGQPDIYRMRTDGTQVQRMTFTPEAEDALAWSPDGQQILFTAKPFGRSPRTQHMKIISITGGQPQLLTETPADYLAPAWSPDSKWVWFSSRAFNPDGNRLIYRLSLDDGHIEPVTRWQTDYTPAFSTDGEWLVFASTLNNGSRLNLHRMRPDGQDLQQLTNNSDNDSQPTFSPDGSQIAYVRFREGKSEVYRLDLDSRVSDNITLSDTYALSPKWSPDGRWIAYSTNRIRDFEIYRVRPDGSDNINLTNHSADDTSPTWSPVVDLPLHGLWLGLLGAGIVVASGGVVANKS